MSRKYQKLQPLQELFPLDQPDPAKQKDLNAAAEKAVLETAGEALADSIAEQGKPNVRPDGTSSVTRLRVHLDR